MGKRELKDLIKQLQKEAESKGKGSELKDAEKELHKRELAELHGGAGLLGLGDAFKHPLLFAKQFHPREAYRSPSDRRILPVAELKKWSKREFGGARSWLRELVRSLVACGTKISPLPHVTRFLKQNKCSGCRARRRQGRLGGGKGRC